MSIRVKRSIVLFRSLPPPPAFNGYLLADDYFECRAKSQTDVIRFYYTIITRMRNNFVYASRWALLIPFMRTFVLYILITPTLYARKEKIYLVIDKIMPMFVDDKYCM